ncbi:MAG: hypothetical protein ACJAUG_002510 [Halioglobus sp.]
MNGFQPPDPKQNDPVKPRYLPFREQLFKTTEATGHWMTPGVDNFRVRQDQMNQRNVAKIIGHFIDKKISTTATERSVFNKVVTKAFRLLGFQLRQYSGVHRIAPQAPPVFCRP